MSVVVAARDVSIRLGRRTIVDGVSLDLARGEIVCLLGPNGAGKSTLLRGLAGGVRLAGGSVERSGRIATCLQTPALARRSVAANLRVGMAWWGVPRAERGQRAADVLDQLGIGHLASRPASRISGGEARRVHIARALATRPDALFLDEPFAGLDPTTRGDLLTQTSHVLRSPDRATLIIVHDRAEAWALADRVLLLLDGRLVAAGPTAEVLLTPPTAAAAGFLGFSGRLEEPDGRVLMARPQDVVLDPDGPLRAGPAVDALEDGVQAELEVAGGMLPLRVPLPGPRVGDEVGVRLTSAVRYDRAGALVAVRQSCDLDSGDRG